MKKILLAGAVLISIGVLIFMMKGRHGTPPMPLPEAPSTQTPEVPYQAAEAPTTQTPEPSRPMAEAPAVPSAEKAKALAAIDRFVAKHPSGLGVAELRRISSAFKRRPDEPQEIAVIAAATVADGSISKEESHVLKNAASLAESGHVTSQDVANLSAKHPSTAPPAHQGKSVSNAQASATIDTYLKKHPTGHGVKPLRRLSKALKSRPKQVQPIAATVVERLKHGPLSKADSTMLEEAATLAEKQGLSAREMAEFSRKYETGAGLSHKPQSASMSAPNASARIPSFAGKRQLIYTFQGGVRCAPTPCANIQVRVHVSAGHWVEEREGGVNGQLEYSLQVPVLSSINEKVLWHLEANDKGLRKAEVSGKRVTTAQDKDVTLENSLVLTPAALPNK